VRGVLLWFFAGFKQDSSGCFRGPSGLSPTGSNGRQGEAAHDGGVPKLHHLAAFGRGLLGLAAASTAITLVVTEPPAWLDRNAYFTVLHRDHPGDRGRRTADGRWRSRISSAIPDVVSVASC
jgi:hypothetical protein